MLIEYCWQMPARLDIALALPRASTCEVCGTDVLTLAVPGQRAYWPVCLPRSPPSASLEGRPCLQPQAFWGCRSYLLCHADAAFSTTVNWGHFQSDPLPASPSSWVWGVQHRQIFSGRRLRQWAALVIMELDRGALRVHRGGDGHHGARDDCRRAPSAHEQGARPCLTSSPAAA